MARKLAASLHGKMAAARLKGERLPATSTRTFAGEFAKYLDYLRDEAEDNDKLVLGPDGKPMKDRDGETFSRWSRNVKAMGKSILLPQWGPVLLKHMSDERGGAKAVKEWYDSIPATEGKRWTRNYPGQSCNENYSRYLQARRSRRRRFVGRPITIPDGRY